MHCYFLPNISQIEAEKLNPIIYNISKNLPYGPSHSEIKNFLNALSTSTQSKKTLGIIEFQNQIVGYCMYGDLIGEWELEFLGISSEHQKKGLAHALIQSSLVAAKSQGVTRILLEVGAFNIPAQKLYQKIGFELIHIRKKYYSKTSEDALVMQYIINKDVN